MRLWFERDGGTRGRRCAAALALFAACAASTASAQNVKATVESRAPLHDVSPAEFLQDIVRLQGMVRACHDAVSGCSAGIDQDDRVKSPSGDYVVRWDWLRDALKDAGTAKPDARTSSMDGASAHLQELSGELSGTSTNEGAEFAKARAKSTEILDRNEFIHVQGPTWWQRKQAELQMWIYSAFDAVASMGRGAPWLGTLLEWLVFAIAGAGVLLLVRRAFSRQRLQIAMAPGAVQWNAWARESEDWAADAERYAAKAEWRDAVHCLYWAAIVKLEARRLWRHNPARTPREYVRLLKPGSPQQGALRKLTGIFERVWYGLRDARAADYEHARTLFDGLGVSTGAGSGARQAAESQA